jgi:hypothetical protein
LKTDEKSEYVLADYMYIVFEAEENVGEISFQLEELVKM